MTPSTTAIPPYVFFFSLGCFSWGIAGESTYRYLRHGLEDPAALGNIWAADRLYSTVFPDWNQGPEMPNGHEFAMLPLTVEEAYALLSLCMMSAGQLDAISENAIMKLADYCRKNRSNPSNCTEPVDGELGGAG